MRTWERARLGGEACGFCGGRVADGQPLRAIYLNDGAERKVRCPACAGEPVNEAELAAAPVAPVGPTLPARDWDLSKPRRVERVRPPRRPVPLADIAKDLPFDGRMAAAGKDDDGLGADTGVAKQSGQFDDRRSSTDRAPREREPGEDDE